MLQVLVDPAASTYSLDVLTSCAAVSSGMALAVDWEPSDGGATALVSGSNGLVSEVWVRPEGVCQALEWQAHDLEAWMAVYDPHRPRVAYSGDYSWGEGAAAVR